MSRCLPCLVLLGLVLSTAGAFSPVRIGVGGPLSSTPSSWGRAAAARTSSSISSFWAIYSTPPRKPRRSLQKRRKKRGAPDSDGQSTTAEDAFWETAELRPLIKSDAQERGEDYWIDEAELEKERERRAQPPKKRPVGQVTDAKLWTEVLSPYRQNWIGFFSVVVILLATIVTKFPELLQPPMIIIPDL
jgi:hypothetical protein